MMKRMLDSEPPITDSSTSMEKPMMTHCERFPNSGGYSDEGTATTLDITENVPVPTNSMDQSSSVKDSPKNLENISVRPGSDLDYPNRSRPLTEDEIKAESDALIQKILSSFPSGLPGISSNGPSVPNMVNKMPVINTREGKKDGKEVVKRFKCDRCEAAFTRNRYLIIHYRIHTGEKPYKCTLCDASFAQMTSHILHMRKHSGERPYKCDQCDAAFISKGSLNSHIRSHSGEKPYVCFYCQAAFTQKSHMNAHQIKHTGIKPWKCEFCEAAFHSRSNLNTHMRLHTGQKPYKCNFCEASFAQKNHLTIHERSHTGEKPYKCDVCSVAFTAKCTLVRHMKLHEGVQENKFKCSFCDAAFSKKAWLVSHEKTHIDENPFKCEYCTAAFPEMPLLVNHWKLHTVENPFKCAQCSEIFPTENSLLVHQKSHFGGGKKEGTKVTKRKRTKTEPKEKKEKGLKIKIKIPKKKQSNDAEGDMNVEYGQDNKGEINAEASKEINVKQEVLEEEENTLKDLNKSRDTGSKGEMVIKNMKENEYQGEADEEINEVDEAESEGIYDEDIDNEDIEEIFLTESSNDFEDNKKNETELSEIQDTHLEGNELRENPEIGGVSYESENNIREDSKSDNYDSFNRREIGNSQNNELVDYHEIYDNKEEFREEMEYQEFGICTQEKSEFESLPVIPDKSLD